MAKGLYLGIDSKARRMKKAYIGIDGKARKVKKMYLGVDGKARLCYSAEMENSGTATPLSVARSNLAAGTIGGYALFAGGDTDGQTQGGGETMTVYNTVDAYNASLTRTTPTALSVGRSRMAATVVGSYLLFGGGGLSEYSTWTKGSEYASKNTVDAYNASLTRSTATALSAIRYNLAAATVGTHALFAGGYKGTVKDFYAGDDRAVATVDAYDTALTRTTPTALSAARNIIAAATVGNYALFGGGENESGTQKNTVDAYNASLTRSTPTALSAARCEFAAAAIGNYAVFAGGRNPNKATPPTFSTVDAYDASLTRTTPTALSVSRGQLTAVKLGSYLLFCGGAVENNVWGTASTAVDAYDSSLTRTALTGLSQARYSLASAAIGDSALMAGGCRVSDKAGAFNTVDVYTA